MDYFDFLNLFGFGRISQIYIIFLDIYVKQICGIWRRLFEINISAFFIFAGADSNCCINSACSRSSMTVYVRMYIGVLMRILNVHVYLCAGVSRLPAILSECVTHSGIVLKPCYLHNNMVLSEIVDILLLFRL